MTDSFIDQLFEPPKMEAGDRVTRKDAGILGRKRGTAVRVAGWFAVIQWDGSPSPRREFIPELAVEDL